MKEKEVMGLTRLGAVDVPDDLPRILIYTHRPSLTRVSGSGAGQWPAHARAIPKARGMRSAQYSGLLLSRKCRAYDTRRYHFAIRYQRLWFTSISCRL